MAEQTPKSRESPWPNLVLDVRISPGVVMLTLEPTDPAHPPPVLTDDHVLSALGIRIDCRIPNRTGKRLPANIPYRIVGRIGVVPQRGASGSVKRLLTLAPHGELAAAADTRLRAVTHPRSCVVRITLTWPDETVHTYGLGRSGNRPIRR